MRDEQPHSRERERARDYDEWRFRGPGGHLHLPRWNKNCYYNRESACGVCVLRLWWGVIALAGRTLVGRLVRWLRGGGR